MVRRTQESWSQKPGCGAGGAPRSKRVACPATCYLVGGGAVITGYGRKRTTGDVDARIDDAEDEVLAAAKTTAERNGLDERWLHVKAAQFVPRGDDVRAKTVLRQHRIRCHRASAEYLLLMKGIRGLGAAWERPGSDLEASRCRS